MHRKLSECVKIAHSSGIQVDEEDEECRHGQKPIIHHEIRCMPHWYGTWLIARVFNDREYWEFVNAFDQNGTVSVKDGNEVTTLLHPSLADY